MTTPIAALLIAALSASMILTGCGIDRDNKSQNNQQAAITKTQICGQDNRGPAIIIVHGGGYVSGDPSLTAKTCRLFASQGFYVINLKYPLADPKGAKEALRKAVKKARRNSPTVYGYGESAGGGLIALAAARSWIDGAFVWAPVSDAVAWKRKVNQDRQLAYIRPQVNQMADADLEEISAINYASNKSAPIVVSHGVADKLVPYQYSFQLGRKWKRFILLPEDGGHEITAESMKDAPDKASQCFLGENYCPWAK